MAQVRTGHQATGAGRKQRRPATTGQKYENAANPRHALRSYARYAKRGNRF